MSHDMGERVRDFRDRRLLDRQEYLDSFAEAPLPLYREFHEAGLANWWLPKERGGLGIGVEESVDLVSELAYGDAGAAFTLFISILGTTMVSLYGSERLQREHLVPMAEHGGFCATLGSERAAGSELVNITTTVSRHGDALVVNGDKLFATNAGFADFLVVVGRSAEAPDEHLAVLVPRDTPGVRIVRRWEMIGLRSSGTYQVSFADCAVPAANALAGPGLRLLEVALNASRILISATAIGVARRIRDLSMDYAEEKRVHGAALVDNPVFAAKLGQIEMEIEVMRNQCRAAGREFDSLKDRPDGYLDLLRAGTLRSALAAKALCGQTGWRIAGVGSEMFGGLGYTHDMVIGKLLRDVRYVSIVEGGDDVLRELVFNRYVVPEVRRI